MIPTERSYPDTTRLLDSITDILVASVTVSAVDLIDVLDRVKALAPMAALSPAVLAHPDHLRTGARTPRTRRAQTATPIAF